MLSLFSSLPPQVGVERFIIVDFTQDGDNKVQEKASSAVAVVEAEGEGEVQNFYLKSLAKDFGRETKDDLCMGIRALPDDGAAQIRKSERTKQVEWNPDLAEVYYTLFVASRVANEYSNIRKFE